MQGRLLEFVGALRRSGVSVSVAESLDAMRAVGAVGIERRLLREALAACLVKDEADRQQFDSLFEEHFPLHGPVGRNRKGQPAHRTEGGRHLGRSGTHGEGDASGVRVPDDRDRRDDRRTVARSPVQVRRGRLLPAARRIADDDARPNRRSLGHSRARQELIEKPFREYSPLDADASRELVTLLAREIRGRLSRRLRRSRRGRLDVRRTFRRAVTSGGVPGRLLFRGPRPGRPDLVALCDVSGSVATVSEYLLGLIAPAANFFRSVETFVYVDHLCPASFENGYIVPHAPLDLYAPSDFGQVLAEYCARPGGRLDRNTILLILGDARNNRRQSRARLLASLQARARAVIWLNPEPMARWNSGDSTIAQYARHCSTVVECGNLRTLLDALTRSF